MSSASTTIARTRSLRTKPAASSTTTTTTTTIPRKPTTAMATTDLSQQPIDESPASHIPRTGSPSRLPTTRLAPRHGSSASISSSAAGSSSSTLSSSPSSASSGIAASTRSKHPPLSGIGGGMFGLGRSASTRHAKTQSMIMQPPSRQVSASAGGSAAIEPIKRSATITGRTLRSADAAQNSTTTTGRTLRSADAAQNATTTTTTTTTTASRQKSLTHLRAKSVAVQNENTPNGIGHGDGLRNGISRTAASRPPSAESLRSIAPATTKATATPRLRNPSSTARPKSMVARVGGTFNDLDAFASQYQQQQKRQQQQQQLQHSRPPSVAEHGPSTPTTNHMAPPPPPKTRPASVANTTTAKPAFNTFQKHYSPAKSMAPKPLTASILAPPSPSKLPANVAASAEASRLRTELLQLHLMHRDASCVDSEWRASAHDALARRFDALAQRNADMTQSEAAIVEERNAAALLARWGESSLEDAVRLLDDVLTGVWALDEPRSKTSSGGRFTRVVRRFEQWFSDIRDIQNRRRDGHIVDDENNGQVVFIDGLDNAWMSECAGLSRRLEGWRASLLEITYGVSLAPTPRGASNSANRASIDRIIDACQAQVDDMLAELDIMTAIERGVVEQEDRWVRSMNRDGEDVDEGQGLRESQSRAGALWRVV